MKIRISLALLLLTAIFGLGDEAQGPNKRGFPKWAFCVAYEVRGAEELDERPVDPNAEKEPWDHGGMRIPFGLINDRNIVDVAALTTRIVKSRRLNHQAAEAVIRGSTQGTERHPIKDSYVPRHIFVFYDYDGEPVAAIEVCFSSNRVSMTPEIRAGRGTLGSFENADLADLAKIATVAGLDLFPIALSLDAYVQQLNSLAKQKTEAEQDSSNR